MAVLALSAIGAGIGGSLFGAAGAGWVIGGLVGNLLFPQKSEGPRLNDLRVTGTEYGQTIPWVAASPRLAGQIIWASEKRETANTESAKGGPEVTTYSYDCDLMVMLTENEISGVSRIWLNSELVYGNGTTKSGVWSGITIYTGHEDQMPDPTYEAAVGAGNAPAYRGRGYVVITGLQLGQGGQIPNLSFEVGTSAPDSEVRLLALFNEPAGSTEFTDFSIYNNNINSPSAPPAAVDSAETVFYDVPDQYGNTSWLQAPPSQSEFGEFNALVARERIAGAFSADDPVNTNITFEVFFAIPPGTYSNTNTYNVFAVSGGDFNLSVRFGPLISVSNQVWRVSLPDGLTDSSITTTFTRSAPVYTDGTENHLIYMKQGDDIYFVCNGVIETNMPSQFASNYTGRDWSVQYIELGSVAFVGNASFPLYLSSFRYSTKAQYNPASFSQQFRPLTATTSIIGSQTTQTLYDTMLGLMLRAGYQADDFVLNDIVPYEKPVRGLSIGQVSATRSTIEQLQSAWFFESGKSDRIYIRPRAETSVVTIPYSDLGTSADPSSEDDSLSLTLSNDLEIPAQIALSYPNTEQDYQVATEHSDRIFSSQESTQTVQLGIGMTSAEAKGVADAMIFDMAAAQTKTTLRVPLKYAYIEPGDIVEAVNFDGRTYRLRVQTKRDTLTIIELECVLDDVGALQSSAITDDGYLSIAEPVTVEQTEFEALDIPILRDADNSAGYYMAVAPIITNPGNNEWKGAQAVRSWNGTDYSELFTTSTACVMGDCSNTLGNWTGGNVYDETNTLTVVTTGGELSSQTRDAMQVDGTLNVAAIGSQANGWEIIRFRNATLTGANTYVLSGLHRGFRGTEWAIGSHVASEQFILLNTGIRRVEAQTSQIGLERFLKAATFGLRLSDVTQESFTDTGIALKPFSPANPVALADGSDIVVTWQRRTRVSYVYGGATPSVPLGEASESYRVRIYDGVTLVRTETVTSPTYTYVAADIASDGFVSTDTITFEICQVSEIIGAGYPETCEGIAP